MKQFAIKVKNSEGLHARPASRLVQLCHNYRSDVHISFGRIQANAKNITEVLSLGVEDGDSIEVTINGRDEDKLYQQLVNFFGHSIKKLKNY
ncbi:MAG: HPr family phosphocarrier protein [Actinomycetota bacterium]